MAIKIEEARAVCNEIALEVKDSYKMLSLHFVIHHKGQRKEAAEIAIQDLLYHPALKNAIKILKTMPKLESSTYLGTAIGKERVFAGLASREAFVGLFTINIDQYKGKKDLKAQIYHFVWHAIVSLNSYHTQNNKTNSKMGILPETSVYVKAHNNLMADSFSSIISAINGDIVTVKKLAFTRAINAISARSAIRPEENPFLLALDVTIYAINQTLDLKIPKKKAIPVALKFSQNIGAVINQAEVKLWVEFCRLSQDMAWRDYTKEEILGSSIYIAQNTHYRALGHMVSETSRIEPSPILEILDKYSSFGSSEYNEQIHTKKLVHIKDTSLEEAIIHRDPQILFDIANKDNYNLSKGRVCGWNAYALQKAAQTLHDCSTETLKHNEIQMKVEKTYDMFSKVVSWDELNSLSKDIIKYRREGEELSLGNISELITNKENLLSLNASIKQSIKRISSSAKETYVINNNMQSDLNIDLSSAELNLDQKTTKAGNVKSLISKIRKKDKGNKNVPLEDNASE
jgi:hypothetical protein